MLACLQLGASSARAQLQLRVEADEMAWATGRPAEFQGCAGDARERLDSSRNKDAGSNHGFDDLPVDNLKDKLEPLVDHRTIETHKADDLSVARRIVPWIVMQSQIYWRQARMIAQKPRRPLDQTCLQLEHSKHQGYRKQGRLAKRWEDDLNIHFKQQTTADASSKWDAVESHYMSSRHKQPARPSITTTTTTQPTTHNQTTGTTMTHDQKEDHTKDDDESTVQPPQHHSNRIDCICKKAATRVSRSHIQHRYKTTLFERSLQADRKAKASFEEVRNRAVFQ